MDNVTTPVAPAETLEDFIKTLEGASAPPATSAANGDVVSSEVGETTATAPVQGQQEATTVATTQPVPPEVLALHTRQMELSERLASMMEAKKAEAQQEAPLVPDFVIDTEDLSPEEREAYATAEPVLNKIAKSIVAKTFADYTEKVVKPLAQRNQELSQTLSQLNMNNRAQSEGMANAQLRALTQSKITDYDGFIQSPTWQTYLDSEAPGSGGITYRTLASMHASNGNLPAIAKMMLDASGAGGTELQKRTTPGSAAAVSIPARDSNKALPYSRFKEAMSKYQKGQLTQEAYQKISDAYEQAALTDRVDYDK